MENELNLELEHYEEPKILRLIRRGVNAEYSVAAWLWVMVSTLVGFLIVYTALFDAVARAAFLAGLPFGGLVLGPLVAIAGAIVIVGMATKRTSLVRHGAFASFCFWVFISFGFYASGGIANLLVLPLWMLIFWGYKYLASYVREHPGI